jgi:zinc transport system substrate-binding protein
MRGRWRGAVLGLLVGFLTASASAQVPSVVVTIKPIHALVTGVMQGVGMPSLIVAGASSPHTHALRPADAQMMANARVVVWVGPAIETFMTKPVRSIAKGTRVVTLMQDAGLTLLPAREGGGWKAHDDHGHGHGHAHGAKGGAKPAEMDGHVWLDPANATRIARHMAVVLGEVDAANAARYRANAEHVVAGIEALDRTLAARLAPLRERPYIVFHDAYQYFEQRYGLAAVGSITVSPERKPGAKRLHEIRRKILDTKAVCVFAEPQFEPALVRTVMEGTAARAGELDPLGAALPAGAGAYGALLTGLAQDLIDCLQPTS